MRPKATLALALIALAVTGGSGTALYTAASHIVHSAYQSGYSNGSHDEYVDGQHDYQQALSELRCDAR